MIPPCNELEPILPSSVCQEASVLSKEYYIPCGRPAYAVVRHDKDRRAYYMCAECAVHNVRNRGGKLVRVRSSKEEWFFEYAEHGSYAVDP